MFNVLRHLTSRDRQSLAIFVGLAMLCSAYFASGILVTYIYQPAEAMEVAKDGTGFTVRVLGLQTYEMAERLSARLHDQRRVPARIEIGSTGQGYLLLVGPLVKRADAETLKNDLGNLNQALVRVVQNCGPGMSDCPPNQQSPSAPSGATSNPTSNRPYDGEKP